MASLLLVDFENRHRLDISGLDESFDVVVFVGAGQKSPPLGQGPPRKPIRPKITFHRILGFGKNALDFHIAFHLGRVYETTRHTACYILSGDKGCDPLLLHLNSSGLSCRRINDIRELEPPAVVCQLCSSNALLEYNDGLWCPTCGRFVVDPHPRHTRHIRSRPLGYNWTSEPSHKLICAYCNQPQDMSDGIYDDGEWMCGSCVAGYASEYGA